LEENSYNPASVSSIQAFANRLTGRSLSEVVFIPREIINSANKGDLGSLVQAFYFGIRPNSDAGPDFELAGLELKVTGVVQGKDRKYRAKERLVLGMINYEELANQEWESSSFFQKCKQILIMFYLYEQDRPVIDRRFVLNPLLFKLEEPDLAVIKDDWEKIREMVVLGRAHEISEGDTNYLGACRKGAGGLHEGLKSQPNSNVLAKARAFAFKPGYVTSLISERMEVEKSMGTSFDYSFDYFIQTKFNVFVGKTIPEIAEILSMQEKTKNQKNYNRQIALNILRTNGDSIKSLEKAGIEMKTIRLNLKGKPRESMSFPGFDFLDLQNEEWESSNFFERIERKFLFVVFRENPQGVDVLHKVFFWNMPYEDRLEAKRVWEETKKRVLKDATNLPGIRESRVAHVRPKAKNANDKIPTPQGGMHVRQAFWINQSYLEKVLSDL
jgi:DNA mismatch repair protein MutH